MGRILAIDYGRKRVGIAVSDPLKMIAGGLVTVHSSEVISYLSSYMGKEEVETIVVGYPVKMDGNPSEALVYINPFIKQLRKKFPDTPIELEDERFTSGMAFQAMIDGGVKKNKRRDKALVDKVSAVIILQSYMERISKQIN